MGLISNAVNGVQPNNQFINIVTLKYVDILGSVHTSQLPEDVIITPTVGKIITENQILDGNMVYERVAQKPYDITFTFTLRHFYKQDSNPTTQKNNFTLGLLNVAKSNLYSFPIDEIGKINDIVFKPNMILDVSNIFLNKLGINQIIVVSMDYNTVRGSVDCPCVLKCKENVYDAKLLTKSLIVK